MKLIKYIACSLLLLPGFGQAQQEVPTYLDSSKPIADLIGSTCDMESVIGFDTVVLLSVNVERT